MNHIYSLAKAEAKGRNITNMDVFRAALTNSAEDVVDHSTIENILKKMPENSTIDSIIKKVKAEFSSDSKMGIFFKNLTKKVTTFQKYDDSMIKKDSSSSQNDYGDDGKQTTSAPKSATKGGVNLQTLLSGIISKTQSNFGKKVSYNRS